jgi:HPr kinase/phosphorylase
MPDDSNIHATCVSLGGIGILLRGPSGAGKSDLALRLLEAGALLVADDRVCLSRRGDAVVARAPGALAGLIEVRGVGIIGLTAGRVAAEAPCGLVCDLAAGGEIERLPEPSRAEILGISLPRLVLDPFEAAAPVKLRLAVGVGPGSIMVGA